MPEEPTSYWLNNEYRTVHKSICSNCGMTANGNLKLGFNRDRWWGPYETLGAAVDASISALGSVLLCHNGCGSWPLIDKRP